MIVDKAGRNVRKGQLVDLPMNGMFTGTVVDVVEHAIAIPGRPPQPPTVLVQLGISLEVKHLGRVNGSRHNVNVCDTLYVVRDVPDEVGVSDDEHVSGDPVTNPDDVLAEALKAEADEPKQLSLRLLTDPADKIN